MKKWSELASEEREEWQRHPVTQAAIGMLRDLEAFHRGAVIISATIAPIDEIRFKSGTVQGLAEAIDRLVRIEK